MLNVPSDTQFIRWLPQRFESYIRAIILVQIAARYIEGFRQARIARDTTGQADRQHIFNQRHADAGVVSMAITAFMHARSTGTNPCAKFFQVGLGSGDQDSATLCALSVQGTLGAAQNLNRFQVKDLGIRPKRQVDDVVRHAVDIEANGAVIDGDSTGTADIVSAGAGAAGRQGYARNQPYDVVQILHAGGFQVIA